MNNKKIIITCIILLVTSLIIWGLTRKKTDDTFIFEEDTNNIKKYGVNEVVPIYVNDEKIAQKYLSEYTTFMLYYPEKAYELLDYEQKQSKFTSYKEFSYYLNQIKSIKLEQARVSKFAYQNINKKRTLVVVDNSGYTYQFIENSLMDYTVIIN